jgi:hypothetical protein
MRKILITITIGVLFTPLFAFGQLWEVGVMLGGSTYSGDLTPGLVDMKQINPAGGVIIRANINKYITIKGNVYDGTISGDDRDATSQKDKLRNLNFKSNILDIGTNLEINLTGFKPNDRHFSTSPYLFIGLSVFKFDPQAYDSASNKWVRLQPLGTEGEETPRYNDRKKYGLTQVSIPFGVGLKHNFSSRWNIGLEFGWRKTFTDYLDDVSNTYVEYDYLSRQNGPLAARMSNRSGKLDYTSKDLRGNSATDDWYMFGGVIISYSILPPACYRF